MSCSTATTVVVILAVMVSVWSTPFVMDYNPDTHLTTPQLIEKYGYPVETHTVLTEDGYYLTMHRIPHGRNGSILSNRPVVFVQHGIVCSSADWVILGPNKALGYMLADAGYDVWLGNARGNTYSRKHLKYDTKSSKFWDFSFHEMGIYDLPAAIDYVLEKTGKSQLYYIGHSMGTTMAYVMLSEKPEYNSKLRLVYSLSPIAFIHHTKSPFKALLDSKLPDFINKTMQRLGMFGFLPNSDPFFAMSKELCRARPVAKFICLNIILGIAGFDTTQVDMSMIPVILGHAPAGTSGKTFLHFLQIFRLGRFAQYDYGDSGNMEMYNSTVAPAYNLDNVLVPVSLHYSDHDVLSTPKPQLVEKNGYPSEEHLVYTEDGYLLTLHRIPHGRDEVSYTPGDRIPVLLQHGLTSSSITWVLNGVDNSLAYELADAGYDVWMGNVRGNEYSRLKTDVRDPDTNEYWLFSWHECGVYDLPAMIDHILNQTMQENLFYIGHSMGTTLFYVMASERPEYNNNIRAMFSLAPVAFMSHLTNPLVKLLSPLSNELEVVLDLLGIYEFLPQADKLADILNRTCNAGLFEEIICDDVAHMIYSYNKHNINEITLPYILKNLPHGASTRMFVHYGQEVVSGRFAQFDRGVQDNIVTYGKPRPPTYNISLITSPVSLHYGDSDDLVNSKDVRRLHKQLPNPIGMFKVSQENFTHVDFISHFNVTNLLYIPIMELMVDY